MRDPEFLRKQAQRCRALLKIAVEPEAIEQFRVWAVELADEADEVERRILNRKALREYRTGASSPTPVRAHKRFRDRRRSRSSGRNLSRFRT
jgi:hypothetical protein